MCTKCIFEVFFFCILLWWHEDLVKFFFIEVVDFVFSHVVLLRLFVVILSFLIGFPVVPFWPFYIVFLWLLILCVFFLSSETKWSYQKGFMFFYGYINQNIVTNMLICSKNENYFMFMRLKSCGHFMWFI